MKRFLILLMLSLVLVSCGSKKRAASKKKKHKANTKHVITKTETNQPTTDTTFNTQTNTTPNTSNANITEIYIANYSAIAMEEMRKYKIPASITLAQGILESASGKGRLAVEANNHFGIKCHDWTGDRIYHDDDRLQECFRKYPQAEQSFEDHSAFLTGRSRYANLFKLDANDYEAWAKGLRAAGYATDRKYPEKLISLIERFKLYQFDDAVLGSVTLPKSTQQLTHEVIKGDTMYSISKRYNTTIEAIQKLNHMNDVNLSIGQILIIKN